MIHQQTRLQILATLYRNGRASFTDLRDGLALTAGNVATHTGRLEAAGYVRAERALTRAGFELHYAITPEGLDAFARYLEDLRELLLHPDVGATGLSGKQTPSQSPGSD